MKPIRIIGIILVSISSLVLIIGILVGLFVRFKNSNETNSLPNAQPGIMHQSNMVYGPNPGLQVVPYGSLQGQGQPTQYSNFGFNGSIQPNDEIVFPNYVGVNHNSHI